MEVEEVRLVVYFFARSQTTTTATSVQQACSTWAEPTLKAPRKTYCAGISCTCVPRRNICAARYGISKSPKQQSLTSKSAALYVFFRLIANIFYKLKRLEWRRNMHFGLLSLLSWGQSDAGHVIKK